MLLSRRNVCFTLGVWWLLTATGWQGQLDVLEQETQREMRGYLARQPIDTLDERAIVQRTQRFIQQYVGVELGCVQSRKGSGFSSTDALETIRAVVCVFESVDGSPYCSQLFLQNSRLMYK